MYNATQNQRMVSSSNAWKRLADSWKINEINIYIRWRKPEKLIFFVCFGQHLEVHTHTECLRAGHAFMCVCEFVCMCVCVCACVSSHVCVCLHLHSYFAAEAVLWAIGATALVSFSLSVFAMQSKVRTAWRLHLLRIWVQVVWARPYVAVRQA